MDSGYLNDDWSEVAVGKAEIIAGEANFVFRKLPPGQLSFDLSLDPGAIGFQPGEFRLLAGGQGLKGIELGFRLVE